MTRDEERLPDPVEREAALKIYRAISDIEKASGRIRAAHEDAGRPEIVVELSPTAFDLWFRLIGNGTRVDVVDLGHVTVRRNQGRR